MSHYRITHTTSYHYSDMVSLCYNEARLIPRTFAGQSCLKYELQIEPLPADYQERLDFYGNKASYFSISTPHSVMSVTVQSEVLVHSSFDRAALEGTPTCSEVTKALFCADSDPALIEPRSMMLESPYVPQMSELASYGREIFTPTKPFGVAVHELMEKIFREFRYTPGATSIATPLREVFTKKIGVCQDFAQIAIGILRSLGYSARYVSGYLETVPLPGQTKLIGSDASHAWFAAWIPGLGWVDFDPTNNTMPTGRHITCSWGRDYSDVIPLGGVIYGGGDHILKVSVDVHNLDTDKRGQ
ncbi:transglutaminase family protein [Chrysiogenes arsenatis]|uniref:transglutaminase family protein n=1 Tax=Chrysiogenes arsenatis TaxID=309797 RepID=UPI00040D7D94|nr:transglutaminase family protein [Chrysiogenes arsenatis]